MKKHIIKIFSALLLTIFFIVNNCHAQQGTNPCSSSIATANKEYEGGNFQQAVDILKPCLKNLSSNEVFEAYRLLALCYLKLNDDKSANESAVSLLKNKPHYKDFPYFDPMDFNQLLDKYDVWSQLEIGFKFGTNFNSVRPINNYSLTGSAATFLPGTGYQAGITVEYFIKKNISVNADFLIEGLNYTRKSDSVSGWNQEFKEKMRYYNIPVSGKYYFYKTKSLQLAAEFGLQTQLLIATNSNIILHNPVTEENVQNTIDQKTQRSKAVFSALMGVTIKYKLGEGQVFGNLRYAYGLSNVVKAANRYENLSFSMNNQYIDSDIAFNPLYLSLGYQFPVLYAVKLKSRKTI